VQALKQPASIGAGRPVLVWLALALIPAFGVTTAVVKAYRSEQRRLAADWFDRGETALVGGRPEDAIEAFRNALTFSRENPVFRLQLARALAAANRPAEARAYLLTLREAQPGNGPVNLELARLSARDGNVPDALRYYHSSIEGAWADSGEARRRTARFELAEFLVRRDAGVQAQSELIALRGDLPDDPAFQKRVARLMLEAGLVPHAIEVYESVLRAQPRDAQAMAGLGEAAFQEGSYYTASSMLAKARAAGASDGRLERTLSTARLVLAIDPYQRRLSTRERTARVERALDAAAARLRACGASSSDDALQQLSMELPPIEASRRKGLPRDPDQLEPVIDLVFRIEQTTARVCGEPQGLDFALLLLARQRQAGP
jgi:predicted Zn-dependent protease